MEYAAVIIEKALFECINSIFLKKRWC